MLIQSFYSLFTKDFVVVKAASELTFELDVHWGSMSLIKLPFPLPEESVRFNHADVVFSFS